MTYHPCCRLRPPPTLAGTHTISNAVEKGTSPVPFVVSGGALWA